MKSRSGGDTRERIISRQHTKGVSKVGEIKQVAIFLCQELGIEMWGTRTPLTKGMTSSLDLVQILNTYIVWRFMCVRQDY